MPVKIDWDVLVDRDDVDVTGIPLWTCVVDYVRPNSVLHITAGGVCEIAGLYCPADGLVSLPVALRVFADYPAGALLGKVGGSTAGQKEGKIFAIGTTCTVVVGDAESGALFVALNTDLAAVSTMRASIKVAQKQ